MRTARNFRPFWTSTTSRDDPDQVLGELTLDKDYMIPSEGEIQWCGKDVAFLWRSMPRNKPSWTCARSAAKKLLADCETWDGAMRELAAKNLTELANNWLSQDEENPAIRETDPITEERTCPANQPDEVYPSPPAAASLPWI